MPYPTPILRVDVTEIGDAAWLVAHSFRDLPVAQWLVPDDTAERERCLAGQFGLLIGHAIRHGRVEGIRVGGFLVAVAVWMFQDGAAPVPSPRGYDRRLKEICGPSLHRFRLLDDTFGAHHPGFRHHHLMLLAVAPERQGQGAGTRLLDTHHHRIDNPATTHLYRPHTYLEATSAAAARLYARHGYRALEKVAIPTSDTTFIPMIRTPVPLNPIVNR